MDVVSIIILSVLLLVLLVASIYLFVYYSSSEDESPCSGYFSKIVVITGMSLCWIQILLLPLDVANSRNGGMGIDMNLFWMIIYILLFVLVLFILPITSSINECDSDWTFWEKTKHVFCSYFISIFLFVSIALIGFAFLSKADIPVVRTNCSILNIQKSNLVRLNIDNCTKQNSSITINVSFYIFSLALISFLSWILLTIYGGIGLASTPMDLLIEYRSKPECLSKDDLEKKKRALSLQAKEVKDLGIQVKKFEDDDINKKNSKIFINLVFSADKREYNGILRNLKAGYLILNKEYELYKLQSSFSDESVAYYYVCLIGFIFSLIGSLTWFLHIILYFVVPSTTTNVSKSGSSDFLNPMLNFFANNNMGFIATALYSLITLYLLSCCIRGCVKFGMRFMCCMEIHPLIKGDTYIGSIIFNTILMIILSISLTQFCVDCFRQYATMTQISMIFGTQIKYLRFFNFFFKNYIFEYALLSVCLLATIYLIIKPSDSNSFKGRMEKLEKDDQLLQESMNSIN